jgi:hypothetical protein
VPPPARRYRAPDRGKYVRTGRLDVDDADGHIPLLHHSEIDAIIEIASIDVLSDGTITDQVSTLVRPGPIPPEASGVHHLIDEDLADAPPLMHAIHLFRGADAYVAHNADFEQGFLGPLLGEATWLCTYKCALRIWPDLPAHNNQALRYRLGFVNPLRRRPPYLEPAPCAVRRDRDRGGFHRGDQARLLVGAGAVVERAGAAQRVQVREAPGRAIRRGADRLSGVDRERPERDERGREGVGAVLAR